MKTKILSILLVAIMLFTMGLGTLEVFAEELSGDCGEKAQWGYNSETGELIITGSGGTLDFNRYPEFNKIPWEKFSDDIKSITVSDGITYVGHSAFSNCKNVISVQLPEQGLTFGSSVFSGCKSLKTINLPKDIEIISEHLFWGCEALESIEIPENVTKISSGAFGDCTGLCEIELPANLEEIGDSAFTDCAELQNINIPDNVYEIGSSAFWKCITLQTVKLPAKLTSIKNNVFYACRDLETVFVGAGVSNISSNAFYSCEKLNAINVSENNETYSSDAQGVLYNKDKTRLILFPNGRTGSYTSPESVKIIAKGAFSYTAIESVTIQGELEELESEAFCCSSVTKLVLPDSIKKIGYKAMYGCGQLEDFEIPADVESIGEQAFYGCSLLEKIDLSEKVIIIGARAFDSCYCMSAINVHEDNPNFSSDDGVLYNKNKTALIKMPTFYGEETYEIADTTVTIMSYAFNECASLESITIPLSAKTFEDYAFYDIGYVYDIYYLGTPDDWKKVDIGEGNYVLEYRTIHYITDDIRSGKTAGSEWKVNLYDGEFYVGPDDMEDYSLSNPAPWYEFADGIKAITSNCYEFGDYAFYGLENLTKVTVIDDFYRFRYLGESAFENCKKLTHITIPRGVSVINERAFAGCEDLKYVTILGELTEVKANAFAGCDSLETVILPQTEEQWEGLSVVIGTGNEAFENALDFYVDPTLLSGKCGNDLYWEFDKTAKELKITGEGEMYDYILHYDVPWKNWGDKAKSISLPEGLTEISRNAFWGFTEITACEIPSTVEEIGMDAFYYCQKLESIEIPAGVKKISSGCFQSCISLKEIILPDTIETLDNEAFQGCVSLEGVEIPNVTEIGTGAFVNCDSIVRFDIPEKVVTIGHGIFEYCDNLEYVTIPASVTNIGDALFSEARKLKSITVDKNNANYRSVDGVLYSKDMSVIICHPGGKKGVYKIPQTVSIIRKKCFDGYFENSIKIPSSVTDIEYGAFPFSTFTDIYYSGSEQQWDDITINGGNACLMSKDIIHFDMENMWPYTKTDMETSEEVTDFTVSTEKLPVNSRVLLACYKDGALVEFRHKVCTSDSLDFTTDKEFDYVKIMAWESIGNNSNPIAAAEEIYN